MSTTPKKALTPSGNNSNGGDNLVLVSEFPPPPYYYQDAYSSGVTKLTPPSIPTSALLRASQQAAAARAAAKEQVEQNRLKAAQESVDSVGGSSSNAISADSIQNDTQGGLIDPSATSPTQQMTDDGQDLIAAFGEIVEDPLLAPVEDGCDDPTKIRDEVSRLNNKVLEGFVELVGELVTTSLANQSHDGRKCRDQLSDHIFLMLQECNKFREHQAREILIESLEEQQKMRKDAIESLHNKITLSNSALDQLEKALQSER